MPTLTVTGAVSASAAAILSVGTGGIALTGGTLAGASVDVSTTGGGIVQTASSTLNAGTSTPGADSYAYYQGTSMATPHVAATAALMLARNPTLTPDQVEAGLKASTRAFPGTCNQCGSGIDYTRVRKCRTHRRRG